MELHDDNTSFKSNLGNQNISTSKFDMILMTYTVNFGHYNNNNKIYVYVNASGIG